MSSTVNKLQRTILGIETSCDETALSLLEVRGEGADFECRVVASLVHSQAALHSAYGGVYPNLAKREHGKNLVPLLRKLFTEAGMESGAEGPCERDWREHEEFPTREISVSRSPLSIPAIKEQNPELFEAFSNADFLRAKPKIDAIAVTEGPGLEPALWVGIVFARMLGDLWQIPVIPVDHMEGHIIGSLLPSDAANGAWQRLYQAPLPAISLLISGGHTEIVLMRKLGDYEIIGQTKDDAVGEAFDKSARLLGLSYPGGPHMAELAQKAKDEGIAPPVKLPRPMIGSKDLDFSFSGLKTAVLYAVRAAPRDKQGNLDEAWKKGLALEFERAVTETLDSKVRDAIDRTSARSLIIGGGVSANHVLRAAFARTAEEYGIQLFMPSRHISGDNALMIALAGALGERKAPGSIRAQGTKSLGK
jgi:N6-L-threonylcarbamoyladenine synthase